MSEYSGVSGAEWRRKRRANAERNYIVDLNLREQNAVISGGTSGIGAGIAEVLAEEGVNLALIYRSESERSHAFAEGLTAKHGVRAEAFSCDATDNQRVESCFDLILSRFGSLEILINNAAGGIPEGKRFIDVTYEEWLSSMNGCLNHAYSMSRRFAYECIYEGHGGHIVNILAKACFTSSGSNKAPYITAKGGLSALTRSLAGELIGHGIFVNGIIPGYVETGYYRPGSPAYTEKSAGLKIGWATPRDMGNIAAFLCSERSQQMIGALVDCSGGMML